MGAHGCQRAAAYGPEGMTQAGGGSQTCCKAGAASGGSCMFSGAAGVCVRRGIRGGGTRSPCRGVKVASTPSTCISLNQAASHSLTLSTVGYVNCLIYLVCSMAPLGPTPPHLWGPLRHHQPHNAGLPAAGSPGLDPTANLHTPHLSMV